MAVQTNNFDFNGFNAMTANKPAGLKLFLAIELLHNVLWVMDRYDNPRAENLRSALSELKELRTLMKQDSRDREARNFKDPRAE